MGARPLATVFAGIGVQGLENIESWAIGLSTGPLEQDQIFVACRGDAKARQATGSIAKCEMSINPRTPKIVAEQAKSIEGIDSTLVLDLDIIGVEFAGRQRPIVRWFGHHHSEVEI